MIFRWTHWKDALSGDLQLSLMLLDGSWEPWWESTLQLGPFCSYAEGEAHLLAQAHEWLVSHGIPQELPL